MIRQCVEDIEICRTRQCTMQQSRTTAQCKPGSLIAVLSYVRAMQCYQLWICKIRSRRTVQRYKV